MMPRAILQRDGEDIHDRMIQGFAAGLRVHLLRIVGAGTNHVVRMVAGVDHDLFDGVKVIDAFAHAESQIDQRLRLILGAVFLGIAVHDGALGFTGCGQRHDIMTLGSAMQHPCDDTVLAFVDRARCTLAAHHPVHRLNRQLAAVRRCIGLPGADFTLAGLAGGEADMHRLLHRLVNHVLLQVQQRADAGGLRRAQMRDVVDLPLMQTNGAHQVDLDFITGGDAADQVPARLFQRLRDSEDGRNIVARMRIVGGQERVVHVQFPHGHAVRPCCPFRADTLRRSNAEHRRPCFVWPSQRHVAGGHDGVAVGGCDRHRGVVDDAIDDHRRHVFRHRDLVGRNAGDLPRQLVFPFQACLRWADLDVMFDHYLPPSCAVAGSPARRTRFGPRNQAIGLLRSVASPERQGRGIA